MYSRKEIVVALVGITVWFALRPAMADDWLIDLPFPNVNQPGVKVCAVMSMIGESVVWKSIFPVTKYWTIEDCQNKATAIKVNGLQLACFFPNVSDNNPPFDFGCIANKDSLQCRSGIIEPHINCGWRHKISGIEPKTEDSGPKGQLWLGDEWAIEPINREIKVCRFSGSESRSSPSPYWTVTIPVTRNFEVENCVTLADVYHWAAAQVTFGCYFYPKDKESAQVAEVWGKASNVGGAGNKLSISVPVPNCGW
jgi:hypothetical protein